LIWDQGLIIKEAYAVIKERVAEIAMLKVMKKLK